jgi:DNA modification methylase
MPVEIVIGDALARLRDMPGESVHCAVTSPPYFGLRDYDVEGQIGLESTPDAYIDALVAVFAELRRVLRSDGTLWLNIGDSYNAAGRVGYGAREGYKQNTNRASRNKADTNRPSVSYLKPKDMIGIPWLLAFALRADGWYLRQEIIWSKPNVMPESVEDRCTKSHEQLFMLSKRERYFYDAAAIAEPATGRENFYGSPTYASGDRKDAGRSDKTPTVTRNKRDVWAINTSPYDGAHFAVMPTGLVEPCILAGTSAKGVCSRCGAPWQRISEKEAVKQKPPSGTYSEGAGRMDSPHPSGGWVKGASATVGWESGCGCRDATTIPATVLDPFGGAGTVGMVADRLQRNAILVELNPDYAAMARDRIFDEAGGLFGRPVTMRV